MSEVDLDSIFELLSNSRRRLILRKLDESGEITLSDLSRYIASVEEGKPESEVEKEEQKRVYVSLYQHHIEKLEEYQIVERVNDSIKLADNSDRVLKVLRVNGIVDEMFFKILLVLVLADLAIVMLVLSMG